MRGGICEFNGWRKESFEGIKVVHFIPIELRQSKNKSENTINLLNESYGILALIEKYSKKKALTIDTEYCLFTNQGDKFILWVKYKLLNETKDYGFEVRSFYNYI